MIPIIENMQNILTAIDWWVRSADRSDNKGFAVTYADGSKGIRWAFKSGAGYENMYGDVLVE